MRIACIDHGPIVGGGQIVLANWIRELDPGSFKPIVVTAEVSPLIGDTRFAGVEMLSIPFGPLQKFRLPLGKNLVKTTFALARIIRQRNIDLIHGNSGRANVAGSFAAAVSRTPIIWTLHENIFPRPLACLLSFIPRKAIAVSQWLGNWYGGCGLKRKMVVIKNGLNLRQVTPPDPLLRREFDIPETAPVILFVGRWVEGKGAHLFVQAAGQAAQSLRDAYFVMVGGADPPGAARRVPDYGGVVEQAARSSGLGKRLVLTGARRDVDRFYASADLVVYASIWPEGLPTVLLEAMLYSKPVVATAIGGALEIVQDGITGRLVTPGQVVELASAMVDLIQNGDRSKAMGQAGRLRLEQEFDLRTQVKRIEQLYRDVLGMN